jgi:clusterin-associated protein 1
MLGVNMYDLIAKETVNKNMRNQYSNLPLELSYVEKSLQQSIGTMKSQLSTCQTSIENVNAEKSNLNLKIQRKKTELDRSRKRFQALQKIKPAYLEEFERIEENLKELYGQYIVRVKCLDALRNFVTNTNSPKSDSPVAKVQDSSIPILPEEGLTDSNDEDDDENNTDDNISKDDPSSINQDIFKQVSTRLKTKGDRKIGSRPVRNVKISDEITISETSPESEELESELDFIMDLEDEDDRDMKFKRDTANKNKAEASDEDF